MVFVVKEEENNFSREKKNEAKEEINEVFWSRKKKLIVPVSVRSRLRIISFPLKFNLYRLQYMAPAYYKLRKRKLLYNRLREQ